MLAIHQTYKTRDSRKIYNICRSFVCKGKLFKLNNILKLNMVKPLQTVSTACTPFCSSSLFSLSLPHFIL